MLFGIILVLSIQLAISTPTNCVARDVYGAVLTDVTMYSYCTIMPIHLVCDQKNVSWSVEPKLPESLSLSSDGIISGRIDEDGGRFLFKATNSEGSSTVALQLTLEECPMLLITYFEREGQVRLFDGSTELITAAGEFLVCLPQKTYSYEFVSHTSFTSTIRFESDGYLVESAVALPYETVKGTIKVEYAPTGVPVPLFPSNPLYVGTKEDVDFVIHSSFRRRKDADVIPPFPKTLYLRQEGYLHGYWEQMGRYSYNVSYSNELGVGWSVLHVVVGICDFPDHLLGVTFSPLNEGDGFVITNSTGAVVLQSTNGFTGSRCLPSDEYVAELFTASELGRSSLTVYGDYMEQIGEYKIIEGERRKRVRITLGYWIHEGESWKYHRGEADGDWTKTMIRDSQWSDSSSGKWGLFDESGIALFQKSTDFRQPVGIVIIELMAEGTVQLFVNGVLVWNGETVATDRKRISLQSSVFNRKTTIIALRLKRSSSAAIQFDLALYPVLGNHLLRSEHGTAAEIQKEPSPDYPPSNAFSDDTEEYWRANTLPASLSYTFYGNASVAVNSLQFYLNSQRTEIPRSFRVEGVENGRVVPLTTVDSPVFFRGTGFKELTFANTEAFSTIRLVFEGKSEMAVRVYGVKLYIRNIIYCQKRIGLRSVPAGDIIYKHCPLGRVGVKQMKCLEIDNEAKWMEDRSSCLPRYPEKGMAYVDSTFRLTNVTIAEWEEKVHAAMNEVIVEQLVVKKKEIRLVYLRDETTNEEALLTFKLRFTLKEKIADYVQEEMIEMEKSINTLLREKTAKELPDLSIEGIGEPTLYVPIPWLKICVYLLITIVFVIMATMLYLRSGGKSKKSLKRHQSRNDDTALLDTE